MWSRLTAVAAAHSRILARRRTALLVLGVLPLAFYGALYRHNAHAVVVGGVASAFSAGGAGIFSLLPARDADRRLALAGYRPWVLVAGRLIPLWAGSLAISAVTAGVMIAGTAPRHPADLFAGVLLTGVVAVPLGLALGSLLPRELEATLVLIGVAGIQLTARASSSIARFLPFHAARQLLEGSVGAAAGVGPRIALSAGYGAALLGVAGLAWFRRVRVRGADARAMEVA